MKTHNLNSPGGKALDAARGRAATRRAGGNLRIKDAAGNDIVVSTLIVPEVIEGEDDDGTLDWPAGIDSVDDGTTTIEDVTSVTVPPGGITDLGDGAILLNFLVNTYEGHVTQFISSSGSALDLDLSAFGTFYIVLDDDCTLTFTGTVPSGVDARWTVVFIQGGAGGFTVTWPAEVTWQDTDGTSGGAAPTLFTAVGAQDVIELATVDGAVTVGGSHGAGTSGGATALDDLSDVALTSPATGDRLRYDGSTWVNTADVWHPVMANDGTNWYVVVDGDGTAVMAEG